MMAWLRSVHRWTAGPAILLVTIAMMSAARGEIRAQTERGAIKIVPAVQSLQHPWSVAFLPDGRLLITERPGRLRIADAAGALSAPLANVPEVYAEGQGGLLDVVLAPDFAVSRTLCLSYSEARDGGSGTSVACAELTEKSLSNVRVVFRQQPAVESSGHFGSRLVFDRDGSLFVTLGERQLRHFAVRAQDLETHFGKVVRVRLDGKLPADNPFLQVPGARPEIWSYGHRNIQGAALHPTTGALWVVEHGPKGGDELNVVSAGANYGWPLVTYGIAYSGDRLGVGAERAGIERPLHHWVPSIATSGLTFYTGERFPQWKGSLFVGGLYGMLVRLELEQGRVVHEERLLREIKQRIRDVRQGPDGNLYVVTDSPDGRIFRIEPAT